VTGNAAGSVMAAGANVTISGSVGNDLYQAGNIVALRSIVVDNAWMAGNMLSIGRARELGATCLRQAIR